MNELVNGFFMILIIATVGVVAYIQDKNWKQFMKDHDCMLTQHVDGYTTYGYGRKSDGTYGQISTYVPSRNAYTCNDGVTYWN